jgi:hypothetical protein
MMLRLGTWGQRGSRTSKRSEWRHDIQLDAAQGGAGGDDGGIGGREAVKVVSIEDNIANGGIGSLDTEGHEPEEGEKDVEDENGPVVVGAGGARVSADKPDGDDEGDEGLADGSAC